MTGATMERKRDEIKDADALAGVEADLDALLGDAKPTGEVVQLLPAGKLGALLHLQTQALDEGLGRCAD